MVRFNLENAAWVLSLFCIVFCLTVNRRQYRFAKGLKANLLNQHVVFVLTLFSLMFCAAVSVLGAMLERFSSGRVYVWQYLLHTVYYLSHITMSVGFSLYFMDITGTGVGKKSNFFILFSLPYLLCVLLVLTNPFSDVCFYIDAQNVYHRGSWLPLLYACGLLYLLLSIWFYFRHIRALPRTDRIGGGVLMLLSVVGVTVQALDSRLEVELFADALTLLGIMLLLEERSGHVDALTGVLNRSALTDACRSLMETRRSGRLILVKLINLDLFAKLYPGSEIDSLVLRVSEWLTATAAGYDLFHYRDRDFAIMVPEDLEHATEALSQTVLKRFGEEWEADGIEFRLDAALCVIRIPEDVSTLSQLNELLHIRLRNIEKGGTRMISYDEISAFWQIRRIERELRDAVANGKLRVWYQPIWSVEEGRTVAAEALLRIDSEMLRSVSPDVYVPIAEQCGVIREIGLFVFEDVCRFLRDSGVLEKKLAYIDVNLSVHQFLFDDLSVRFEAIREQYGIPRGAINLEITETASMQTPAVEAALRTLREIGYHLSLDDFGTGYSNLVQLIRTNYKNVKIDKSLLWDGDHNENAARLLDDLIRVIRSLGCNVVQEGVETPAQLERCASSGANLIQGYYFSRPIPEQEFLDYLKRGESN